jgi:MOSC domain-containing protein YiiM
MRGTLSQLNVSAGGMPKTPVLLARVTRAGVEGDRQKNKKYHGGPDRAVCLYSEELYAWLQSQEVNVRAGDVGENFTTREIDLASLSIGDRLKVGECLIEITNVRIPCRNLNKWHPDLMKIIQGRSGWVAKVIEEGIVRPGDAIDVQRAFHPDSR